MMDFASRTVFENWMQKGYRQEVKGDYEMAASTYIDAYELADSQEDSAKFRAKDAIMRCKKYLEAKEEGLTR